MKKTLSLIAICLFLLSCTTEDPEVLTWDDQQPSELAGTAWQTTFVTMYNNLESPAEVETYASACDRTSGTLVAPLDLLGSSLTYFQNFSVVYNGRLNVVTLEPCSFPDDTTLLVEDNPGSEYDLLYFHWDTSKDPSQKDRPGMKIQVLEKTATTMKLKVLSISNGFNENVYGIVDLEIVD